MGSSDRTSSFRAVLNELQAELLEASKRLTDVQERTQKMGEEDMNRRIKHEVISELRRQGCKRPQHTYVLLRDKFFYNPEEMEIMGGSKLLPVPLEEAIGKLRKDSDYSYLFEQPTQPEKPTEYDGPNPFEAATKNATKAAEILQRQPAVGRSLYRQAVQKGTVDPVFERAFAAIVNAIK